MVWGTMRRQNPTAQHVVVFAGKRSNYTKGGYERHKLQAVISSNFYLLETRRGLTIFFPQERLTS